MLCDGFILNLIRMLKLTVAEIQMLESLHYSYAFSLENGFLNFRILEADLYRFSKCAKFRNVNPLLRMFFDENDTSLFNSLGINDNYIVKFWDNFFDEKSTEELDEWNCHFDDIAVVSIPYQVCP